MHSHSPSDITKHVESSLWLVGQILKLSWASGIENNTGKETWEFNSGHGVAFGDRVLRRVERVFRKNLQTIFYLM
ncbi:MAG: hypothetical protein NVS9B5_25850 [Terriglobales bacterium]